MAMKLDVAEWNARDGMRRLLDALDSKDGQTRFVGGAVRDRLLGQPVSDIDLATRFHPAEVQRRLSAAGIKVVPTGIDHGTVTAVSSGQVVEITTLRRDVSTDGRRATVAFTDDWREDAARRDFTINALFADPVTGDLFDYFGGLDDLGARRIRFIGDPLQRIAEDHLRILRFFRFHARFGSELDTPSLDACTGRANDLMALSRERIADELLKLLALPDPTPTVRLMLERGVLRPVLPEIEPAAADRMRTLIAAELEAGVAPDPLRRLASLLPRQTELVANVAARLKFSNKARKRLGSATLPDLPVSAEERAYRLGTEAAIDSLLLESRADEAAAVAGWPVPRLPIGGGELIARGVPQGPLVARTLRAVEDAWIAAGFPAGSSFESLLSTTLARTGP